jgi:hypothetical protein
MLDEDDLKKEGLSMKDLTEGMSMGDLTKEGFTKSDATKLPTSPILEELGYTGELPWSESLKLSELDRSTMANHRNFVKDVRRFSSGANFTSVTDDNTSLSFNDFLGLRRPQHVPIGKDARTRPDIDESVLQRNKPFIFNFTDYSKTYA